ncbi:hypothetical protein pb186bvf_009122 [Paramecium bursaria]
MYTSSYVQVYDLSPTKNLTDQSFQHSDLKKKKSMFNNENIQYLLNPNIQLLQEGWSHYVKPFKMITSINFNNSHIRILSNCVVYVGHSFKFIYKFCSIFFEFKNDQSQKRPYVLFQQKNLRMMRS